jgi:hypothetical protein
LAALLLALSCASRNTPVLPTFTRTRVTPVADAIPLIVSVPVHDSLTMSPPVGEKSLVLADI